MVAAFFCIYFSMADTLFASSMSSSMSIRAFAFALALLLGALADEDEIVDTTPTEPFEAFRFPMAEDEAILSTPSKPITNESANLSS